MWTFQTFTIGETPFPEYTAVVKLDDIELVYYDNTDMLVCKAPGACYNDSFTKIYQDVFLNEYEFGKQKALTLRQHLNHSDGK